MLSWVEVLSMDSSGRGGATSCIVSTILFLLQFPDSYAFKCSGLYHFRALSR